MADHLGSVRQLTNASGGVTLANSYQPYGTVLASTGSGASGYGFTGEWTDNTGLVYLRARYYASGQGRFISFDPSRMENNWYQYSRANPVNHTDPTGLFSREIVADSFGYSSFVNLLSDTILDIDGTGILKGGKWGWLATLLAAKPFDRVQVGNIRIATDRPYVDYYSPWEWVWLNSKCEIMIGGQNLFAYTNYVVDTPSPREFILPWRDTSASHYRLLRFNADSGTNIVGPFVDGTDKFDYPDFHSLDVSLWRSLPPIPWPGGKIRPPIPTSGSLSVDRFGNIYWSSAWSIHPYSGGLAYSEGYVCNSPFACTETSVVLADEATLFNTMIGQWYGGCVQVNWGACYFKSGNSWGLQGALVFSAGYMLNVNFTASYGWWLAKDTSLSWNWAFNDRIQGITVGDLLAWESSP